VNLAWRGFCCETECGHGCSVRLYYSYSFHSVVHDCGRILAKDVAADASADRASLLKPSLLGGATAASSPSRSAGSLNPVEATIVLKWPLEEATDGAMACMPEPEWKPLHPGASYFTACCLSSAALSLLELDTVAAGLGYCRLTGSPMTKRAAHAFRGYSWMMVRIPRSPFTTPLLSIILKMLITWLIQVILWI
jgi:hypothetical protein